MHTPLPRAEGRRESQGEPAACVSVTRPGRLGFSCQNPLAKLLGNRDRDATLVKETVRLTRAKHWS